MLAFVPIVLITAYATRGVACEIRLGALTWRFAARQVSIVAVATVLGAAFDTALVGAYPVRFGLSVAQFDLCAAVFGAVIGVLAEHLSYWFRTSRWDRPRR